MLTREDILSMIPHQGGMCLWDRVLSWDTQSVHLQAGNHVDPSHPLRHGNQLHAIHLCEYGAQAMAVHGGLRARERADTAAPGVLVALRDVHLHVARIDELDGPLEAHAQVLVESEASQQYAFRILHHGRLLAAGRAAVMLQLPA